MTGERQQAFQRPSGWKLALWIAGGTLLFAVLWFLLFAFVMWGMGRAHREFDITYENRTGQDIGIFLDEEYYTFVPANETITVAMYHFEWNGERRLEARNRYDRVLFSATLSKEDLQRMNWRLVVPKP